MAAERGQHFQLGIRQWVKSIQPNGANGAKSFGGDARGSQLQAPCAQREAAAFEGGFDFLIDREKRRRQRRIGEALPQALAVAASRGKLGDRVRQRRAEPGEMRHLPEFGAVDSPHRFFDGEVNHGLGSLNHWQGPRPDEAR